MKRDVLANRGATLPDGSPTAPLSPAAERPAYSTLSQRLAGPHSRDEVEAAYVAARDAWAQAMRAANSGRTADMASLAIAQEAFEAAAAERTRWGGGSGTRVAIPVAPEPRRNIEVILGQEVEWNRVHQHEPARGLIGRLKRRLGG
jgi:hypothetical protein